MDTSLLHLAVAVFAASLLPPVLGARTLHVNNTHPRAADPEPDAAPAIISSSGTSDTPFRAIGAAAALAQPGDTIYVHPGIYREHIAPGRGGTANAPITYEAAPGHQVFVRGSEIWTPDWAPVADAPDGVYSARLDDALFAAPGIARNPYRSLIRSSSNPYDAPARPVADFGELTKKWLANKQPGRLPRTCGQLFVDGAPLLESETVAEVLRVPGTWIVDEAGERIIAHFLPSPLPPARRFVELSVRDRIFVPARRGLRYIVVRGFVFEHAANQGLWPQLGAVSLRSGSRWLVENNIIRLAKTIGMDAGSEGYGPMLQRLALTTPDQQRAITGRDNVIRNNVISDNGMSGLIAWHCHGIVIEGNRIERNNALEFKTGRDHYIPWWEQAGIKLHAPIGARIENNLVRDNHAHGIFIDNEYKNARVTNNIVLNNAGAGIMFELGHGPAVIDNNVIAFTRALQEFFGGDGIYGQDASGVTVAHNLLYSNIRHGVYFRHNENRKSGARKPSAAADNHVLNNLIFDNAASAINLPADGPTTGGNFSDYNIIGQRLARFIANQVAKTTPGGTPSVQDEFRRRLSPGGDAARAASRKDYSAWTPGDGLTFAEWRALTGRDTHSIVQNPKLVIIRPATLEAEFFPGAQKISTDYDSRIDVQEEKADGLPYAGLRAPPVALPQGVAGSPLPSGDKGVIPGPWQFLKNHNQRFFLRATPTTPSPAGSAKSATAPPAVAAKALPEKPEDLFRFIGDTRPVRLVLDEAATLPADNTFAWRYSDYSGNTLATGSAPCDPATRVLTLPPPPLPPASPDASGGFVELSFPALQNRVGIVYGIPPPARPDEFFAIDGSFTWGKKLFTEAQIRSCLAIMKYGGLLWNRDRFRWGALHPEENGPFDFNSINHTLYRRIASGMGIQTLDTFHGTPEWLKIPKEHPADQVTSFTKAISHKFREAGMTTRVVGGVFANPWAGTVMQKAYLQNGLLDTSDAISWHTYARAEVVERPVVTWRQFARQANPARAGIPLWITETGMPWLYRHGMERADAGHDIESAAEIAGKAVEYKALGVEKHFAFSFKFYAEPANNKAFGMMDANHTPMRSMAAYAHMAKTLANFDYIGDLAGTNARRSRVFHNAATGQTIAVLYHPVSDKKDIPHFVFPGNLPLVRITGIDGRVLDASGTAGGGEGGGEAPHDDGLVYLHLSGKPGPGLLKTDTPAMECLEMARDFRRRGEPRKTASVVFQSMLNTADVVMSRFGYSLRNFSGKPFDFTLQNLSDIAQTVHPVLELPAGMTAAGLGEREHVIPPGGRETLSFRLTIDPAVEPEAFRMVRVVDRAGSALPIAFPVRAWRIQTKTVPALPQTQITSVAAADLPPPPPASPAALLAENGWQDFSSPGHWTTWQGGEMEPTIEARFRAFHTKSILQIQVLVRDNNLCLFDTPEKAMSGDSVHVILQQRNPDGTVKQRPATVNVVAVQCDGKPFLVWRAWNATKTTFYEKSRLHFQDLGNDWYLYTLNLDAAEMSLDLSSGSMTGASVTVNNHSGFARDGFLSWGGGSDARLFNCLKIE